MKLTQNDIQFLNRFLNEELEYRETFNEMQDHILSALESYPENETFESALQQVLDKHFSGTAGLHAIEIQYRSRTILDMRNRYFKHVIAMFTLPNVIYTAVIGFAAYSLLNYLSFNKTWYLSVFFIVIGMPGIINGIRYISSGYYSRTTKRSIADDGFRRLKYAPGMLFTLFMAYHFCFLNEKPSDLIYILKPGAASVVFMFYFLHATSLFKMYKEEFKMYVAR
jgi:hypothetical protein